MTDLTAIEWSLDALAAHWLADDELTAVTDWMTENDLGRATADHPVVVESGMITFGQDRSADYVRGQHRNIVTITLPLRTPPPAVRQPTCDPASLAELQSVLRAHEWSSGFGGICVDCSQPRADEHGRLWCHRHDTAPWPCPTVWEALYRAGMPVPSATSHDTPCVLGDLLDHKDNARAFGQSISPQLATCAS